MSGADSDGDISGCMIFFLLLLVLNFIFTGIQNFSLFFGGVIYNAFFVNLTPYRNLNMTLAGATLVIGLVTIGVALFRFFNTRFGKFVLRLIKWLIIVMVVVLIAYIAGRWLFAR